MRHLWPEPFLSGFSRPPLTQRLDGALLRVLVLTGLPAGHQGGDGERVGPGRELRFRGGRVLHVGGGGAKQREPDQNIPLTDLEKSSQAPTGGPPAEGNQQICPACTLSNEALWTCARTHVGPGWLRRWSEGLLLFGELQPSSYNSCSPPIRASAPTSRSRCPGAALVPSNQ